MDTLIDENQQEVTQEEIFVLIFAMRYSALRNTSASKIVCDFIRKRLPFITKEQKFLLQVAIMAEDFSEENSKLFGNLLLDLV